MCPGDDSLVTFSPFWRFPPGRPHFYKVVPISTGSHFWFLEIRCGLGGIAQACPGNDLLVPFSPFWRLKKSTPKTLILIVQKSKCELWGRWIGGMADWRTGGLADWRIGGLADRRRNESLKAKQKAESIVGASVHLKVFTMSHPFP